ncbi:MAG: hypothetical protein HY912_02005 [Desulfomonile tiedjei]|uniref:Uncharacterized protein n=1 Tax=Desulfomonile tiedjei TaxID=2358 RepID=A0A9D6V054_9BACT|nr:hypothetical protein [Desulfomonile tiedjei]
MDSKESLYWALFCLSLFLVLVLLAWEPLFTRYKTWKLKRAFRMREEAGRTGKT